MAHDFLLLVAVKESLVGAKVELVVVGQELLHDGIGIDAVFRRGHDFDTVAGGKNQPFADALAMHQVGHRLRETRFRDVHPFADLDGRGAMIDADES